MSYITREDGERFVVPSYRDVITAKQKSQLKKEVFLLSESYGEYITMQKKGSGQYELAFSSDSGYLLGESIWQNFNRPMDMIYCEVLPNTTEAILVIVKSGVVYLDGSFQTDTIPEELIIFLTQQNNFEIYLYGDVPISQAPEPGKFSFEATSVKSFSILDKPVFPTLPLLKIYQLQLVDAVLKAQGIGVFPYTQVISGVVIVGLFLVWMLTGRKTEVIPTLPMIKKALIANPYVPFYTALQTPAPDEEINRIVSKISDFYSMVGWTPKKLSFLQDNGNGNSNGNGSNAMMLTVESIGGSVQDLEIWAKSHNATIDMSKTGFYLNIPILLQKRPIPTKIYSVKEAFAHFVDVLSSVYPGNPLQVDDVLDKGVYKELGVTISFDAVTPAILGLIGDQLKDLPVALQSISIDSFENGNLTGTLVIKIIGS